MTDGSIAESNVTQAEFDAAGEAVLAPQLLDGATASTDDDSPVRTHERARTFRLRDSVIVMIAFAAAWWGIAFGFTTGVLPYDTAWANGVTSLLLIGAAAAVLAVGRRRGIRLRDLLIRDRPWYVESLWGVGVACAILLALQIVHWLHIPIADPLNLESSRDSLAGRWTLFVVGALLAPIGEELLFRGLIQSSLVPQFGLIAACLTQAILFASFHPRGWTIVILVSAVGVAFGALAFRRRCLLPSMVAHGTMNAIAGAWVIGLFWLNAHVPAATTEEALFAPAWIREEPLFGIPEADDAYGMVKAIDFAYGDQGLLLRKDEIKSLRALRERFPGETAYCAYALLREGNVYLYELHDPRRAIHAFEQAIDRYPEDLNVRLSVDWALVDAHLKLGDEAYARHKLGTLEARLSNEPDLAPLADYLRARLDAAENRESR